LNRMISKSWRISGKRQIAVCLLAFIISELLIFIFLGDAFPNILVVSIGSVLAISGIAFVAYVVPKVLLSRFLPLPDRLKTLNRTASLSMYAAIAVVLVISGAFVGPVPANHSKTASAVGSFRSTPTDLARFLIELADPELLSDDLAAQIPAAQVPIYKDFSWGLGVGIQHSSNGDAVWQNGITLAFRGIMAIYPREGIGVVVLTNSGTGLHCAYDVAGRALGGKAEWVHF